MTTAQAKALLISLLPPRFVNWFDFSTDSFGDKILSGAAEQFALRVGSPVDIADADNNPWTITSIGLAAWETALGIANSRTALYGSVAARLAVVIARLREHGATTIPNARAILGPIAGYVDPTQLVILEVSRADLTTANTYLNATSVSIVGGGSVIQGVHVGDAGAVSKAGARLIITNPNISDLNDIQVLLGAPDLATKTFTGEPYFRGVPDPLILYAPELAGAQIDGTWGVNFISVAGNFSCDSWSLVVEGIGRDAVGFDGRGAEIFEWGPYIDPALAGLASAEDDATLLDTVQRIKPAHTIGVIVKPSLVPGAGNAAIPDDANAIPDQCIPG